MVHAHQLDDRHRRRGDGGSLVDHYVDELPAARPRVRAAYGVLSSPGMEKTNGTLKQIDQGLRLYSSSSSGVVFVDCAGNGALLRFAYRGTPRRAAVVVGQALGLFPVLADAA